ncbi:ComF family protein [Luteipulveratus halotolerans]|uniref:Phosphoribosyltransferase domain-containing protein n=1 Tax=Luteipulveratus halotolerans TaxID=1631356 RepID=A0A0L6CIU8_9MICO|nr:phosphoribosyltransferase family protein [Luteipulveratus halotolerans]KNX37726.1 hypothetical protein VV01_12150 [Luteipulveratus halotolerans]
MTALTHALLDLVLPVRCAGCDVSGEPWCASCRGEVVRLRQTPARRTWPDPCPPGFPPTWAATSYDGPVRAAVVAHKDGGRVDLLDLLAAWWCDAAATALEADDLTRSALRRGERVLVVPAPSSGRSVRERGRDPWAEVVEQATRGRSGLVASSVLQQVGRVRDQAGLSAAQRWANLEGAVRVRRGASVDGATCLLADDVVTTGSTLTEAARALHHAGAHRVVAVVLAATPRTVGAIRRRRGDGRLP